MCGCACDYAYLCYEVSLWLFKHVHVIIHIHDMHQFVIMNAWACEYAHLWWADSLWLCMHVHVIMHIHAMQPARNYECMSMWLCTFMLCKQFVTMHACAYDYAHLCYAARLSCIYLCQWLPSSLWTTQLAYLTDYFLMGKISCFATYLVFYWITQ